jgi:DNA-binding CsgD family transcriptional regulator
VSGIVVVAETGEAFATSPWEPPAPSVREVQVVAAVADGCTNAEVAARLGITPDTAKAHLGAAFRKLRVRDRAGAVAAGFRAGWLS